METPSNDILLSLSETLAQRKNANPQDSYVASLYEKGLNKILEKVGEEAVELILAAKDYDQGNAKSRQDFVGELSDLWFHCLVLLQHLDIPLEECLAELHRRQGVSGHTEKASRESSS